MSEVKLVDQGWLMWCDFYNESIFIDNFYKWFEQFFIVTLTHETIHFVIYKLEGTEATFKFDNMFGFKDASILLIPEEDNVFHGILRGRLKGFWNDWRKDRKALR